jgi:hypothetical protein
MTGGKKWVSLFYTAGFALLVLGSLPLLMPKP